MASIVGTVLAFLLLRPSVVGGLRVHAVNKEDNADATGLAASAVSGQDPSSCDPVSSRGDPHIRSITGETFDLWKTGWSTFVQIPKDVPEGSQSKLLVRGLVESYSSSEPCAPSFLKEVLLSGSSLLNRTIAVRAGSLESEVPFALSYDGGVWEPVSEASKGMKQLGDSITVKTDIAAPEPDLWGPDAHTSITVAGTTVDIQQHTEGRHEASQSMLDLAISGLDDTTESVGGWLGMDGSKLAGAPPKECGVELLTATKPKIQGSKVFVKPHDVSAA